MRPLSTTLGSTSRLDGVSNLDGFLDPSRFVLSPPDHPHAHFIALTIFMGWRACANLSASTSRIDDMSKLSTRKDLPHHKTLARAFEDEDLLRAPLSYCVLEDKGGWTR